MQFSKLAATISLFAGALASPVANPDPLVHPVLAKRAEGIHLVNCGNTYSEVIVSPNTFGLVDIPEIFFAFLTVISVLPQ